MAVDPSDATFGGLPIDGTMGVEIQGTPKFSLSSGTLNIGTVVAAGTTVVSGGTIQPLAGTVTVTAGTVVVSNGAFATAVFTQATAGTTAIDALAANAGRLYARLQNDGTAAVYLRLGGTAVANTGIRLEISGAGCSYEMSKQNGNLYTGIITVVSSAGTNTVLVAEGT